MLFLDVRVILGLHRRHQLNLFFADRARATAGSRHSYLDPFVNNVGYSLELCCKIVVVPAPLSRYDRVKEVHRALQSLGSVLQWCIGSNSLFLRLVRLALEN